MQYHHKKTKSAQISTHTRTINNYSIHQKLLVIAETTSQFKLALFSTRQIKISIYLVSQIKTWSLNHLILIQKTKYKNPKN